MLVDEIKRTPLDESRRLVEARHGPLSPRGCRIEEIDTGYGSVRVVLPLDPSQRSS